MADAEEAWLDAHWSRSFQVPGKGPPHLVSQACVLYKICERSLKLSTPSPLTTQALVPGDSEDGAYVRIHWFEFGKLWLRGPRRR